MVRTYWFVPGFNEASGNLDLQPFARIDHVEACRPRAMCASIVRCRVGDACMSEREFDAIVLGAGAAGRGLRRPPRRRRPEGGDRRAAPGRRRVLLLRLHALEGAAAPRRRCSTRRAGCPASPRRSSGELDPQAVLDRRDEVIHDLDDSGQLPWLEERGIELFRGEGRLDGERRVRVGDDVLTADTRGRRRHRQRRRRCRRSTASTRCGPGTTARRRPRSGSRRAWSCSAAARSAASWPRPGRRSAPR